MISLDKLKEEAVIHVFCFDEHIPIKGNASAIDDETDEKIEVDIIEQLNSGNPWAWCTIKVYAEIDGFKGSANYLGACSYKSREDFLGCGYFEDMKDQALEDLKNDIEEKHEQFAELVRDLS